MTYEQYEQAGFYRSAAEIIEDLERQLAAVTAERDRLLRGEFTAEEIHNICHDLHGKVSAREFADGCAAEQRKLYGEAPHADERDKWHMARDKCERQFQAKVEELATEMVKGDELRERLQRAEADAARLWAAANARRVQLIQQKHSGKGLSPAGADELALLQSLADEHVRAVVPLPIDAALRTEAK